MRYISDDGKVFNTEQECCEYEQKIKQERIKKEKLEIERQNRLNSINKKYEDLQKDISDYKEKYDDTGLGYISFEEFVRKLVLGYWKPHFIDFERTN